MHRLGRSDGATAVRAKQRCPGRLRRRAVHARSGGRADGQRRRAWAFVMTLCFSRHQYVEFVWDQTVATWLGCHRRAFEWFGGVPERVIIDNPKCANTRACVHDPSTRQVVARTPRRSRARWSRSLWPQAFPTNWAMTRKIIVRGSVAGGSRGRLFDRLRPDLSECARGGSVGGSHPIVSK